MHDVSEGDPIRKACSTLRTRFGRPCWLEGIGAGTGKLVVYVKRRPYPFEDHIPDRWEGYPVETVVTGGIVPLGGPIGR